MEKTLQDVAIKVRYRSFSGRMFFSVFLALMVYFTNVVFKDYSGFLVFFQCIICLSLSIFLLGTVLHGVYRSLDRILYLLHYYNCRLILQLVVGFFLPVGLAFCGFALYGYFIQLSFFDLFLYSFMPDFIYITLVFNVVYISSFLISYVHLLKVLVVPAKVFPKSWIGHDGLTGKKIINESEVAVFIRRGKYIFAILFDKSEYIVDRSIERLEEDVAGNDLFYLINPKCIVNMDSIDGYVSISSGRALLKLIFFLSDVLEVSQTNTPGFKVLFNKKVKNSSTQLLNFTF